MYAETDEALKLVFGGSGAAITLVLGARWFWRRFVRDNVEVIKDRAEGDLYSQLAEQVRENKESLETVYGERNELAVKVARLETKLEDYEEVRIMVGRLKDKLAEKDTKIESLISQMSAERQHYLDEIKYRDRRIEAQATQISQLEGKLHDLELRLVNEERRSGALICPHQTIISREVAK